MPGGGKQPGGEKPIGGRPGGDTELGGEKPIEGLPGGGTQPEGGEPVGELPGGGTQTGRGNVYEKCLEVVHNQEKENPLGISWRWYTIRTKKTRREIAWSWYTTRRRKPVGEISGGGTQPGEGKLLGGFLEVVHNQEKKNY